MLACYKHKHMRRTAQRMLALKAQGIRMMLVIQRGKRVMLVVQSELACPSL